MPISIKELGQARKTPAEKILEFLAAPEQRDKAFRMWEILQAVDGVPRATAIMAVLVYAVIAGESQPTVPTLDALRQLVADGKVRSDSFNGEDYYYLPPVGKR